ncbi:glycosyltransferase [Magnetospirillum fulvum]|uniref:Glycosyl transferases group 1 n=1 Tax=Magnetospirillum fulvum TaxID=1082 RepID=A0A1H6H786_MAGFU|nr:glycosyltransferase [Magnetospirillum fulvum]SEH30154.1 Glycosyl transferases group 1 [Magnetospirillum fulvum]
MAGGCGDRPSRIGLRVISSPGWRGGVNYIINWARACASVPVEERPEIWLLPYDERGQAIAAELAPLVAGIRPFAEASLLDLDMVYPATQIFEAPFGVPWAGWVPDWQCKHLPELFDPVERARRDLHYGLLAQHAPFLVLSSSMAVADSRRLYPKTLVPHAQLSFPAWFDTEEVAAACAALPEVKARYDLPERFFLVANQWWRHKNHELVIAALAKLDGDFAVVCTGATIDHRWPDYPKALLESDAVKALGRRLRVLGSVDRSDQLAMMLGAVAIIQPSRFEGWSTIVEEARTLNRPLLLSRMPVHEEQNPPGCRFFDCDNASQLAEAMRAALDTPIQAPVLDVSAEQSAYVRSCVAQLCTVARAVRQAYDPARHDPALLLADLTAGLDERGLDPALAAKVHSGVRNMLSCDATAAERYRRSLAARPRQRPTLIGRLRSLFRG